MYDFENDDLLSEVSDLLDTEIKSTTNTVKVEADVEDENAILVPSAYQVISTVNNLPTGKKEVVDTYYCDRVKGIVPIGKARVKADLMRKAFKNKTYFVIEFSSKILSNGKVKTSEKIVYTTK